MTDGRLCYLDFGMMGRIDRTTRQALIRATLHMVNREFDALATDFVTLGLLPEDAPASREEIIAALQGAKQSSNCEFVFRIPSAGSAPPPSVLP